MGRLKGLLRWNTLARRLSGTLIISITLLLVAQATVQTTLQDGFFEHSIRDNGIRLSEALFGALHGAMLANDRERLHTEVRSIASHSPGLRIRVFNKEGQIVFSSVAEEHGTRVDLDSEACFSCHAAEQPIERLKPGDRTRTFTLDGYPAIGVIRPIENEPSCARAGCHEDPKHKRLLGVLDVTLMMTGTEASHGSTVLLMLATALVALLLTLAIVVMLVHGAVHRPVSRLIGTLERIGRGESGVRHPREAILEFDQFGDAVNNSAHDLEKARAELVMWAQSLERRVEAKTRELHQAQEQVIHAERMASLGRLAAVVAHEINNPLASVLIYSRLLLKRFKAVEQGPTPKPIVAEETIAILDSIAVESKRCGEIVSNLLLFARRGSSLMEPTDVNALVGRVLFLIEHMMHLHEVEHVAELDPAVGEVLCDPSRFEQALLALCVNAIDAMAEGGTLTLRTIPDPPGKGVRVEVQDTGVGIPDEVVHRIFEPFFTTKGESDSHGHGLGLAVVYGIVQRHGGNISVKSAVGEGTTFTLHFPGEQPPEQEEQPHDQPGAFAHC